MGLAVLRKWASDVFFCLFVCYISETGEEMRRDEMSANLFFIVSRLELWFGV